MWGGKQRSSSAAMGGVVAALLVILTAVWVGSLLINTGFGMFNAPEVWGEDYGGILTVVLGVVLMLSGARLSYKIIKHRKRGVNEEAE